MKFLKTILGACAALGLALGAAGSAQAQAKDPIVIGLVMPYSGWFQPIDEATIKGVELAVEEINAKGGVLGRPLQIVSYDMKSEPPLGANGAIEVIDKGAKMIVVPSDFDFGGPGAFVAQSRGVISFAGASDPKFGVDGIGNLAYSSSGASVAEGAMLAEWAYKEKGFRRAYVLLDNTIEFTKSLCRGFAERWKGLAGGSGLVGEDKFLNNDPSIASQITRLRALDPQPEVIMICSYAPGGPSAIRQIRAAGLDQAIMTGNSMDGDYWIGAVPNLSNFYVSNYGSMFGDDPDPKINAFFERYQKHFGARSVVSYSLRGYAKVEAFARAVERAGSTDGAAVAAELDKFKNEPLVIGPTTFTPELHIAVDRPLTIMQVQNGKFSAVARYAPESWPPLK